MASVDIKGDAPADSDAFWPAAQLQLWAAAEKGDREGVERAMAAQEQDDAECTARANRMGWTALHRAAMGGSAECVEMLLAVPACAKLIDAKDNSGCAALHIACGLGHAAVVRALLVAGASAKAVTTEEARTPMHFACQGLSTSDEPSGHTVVILMLLAAGGLIEAADSNGILAIQLARQDQLPALLRRIKEHGERQAWREQNQIQKGAAGPAGAEDAAQQQQADGPGK
tara:strand:- start:2495 stop:3181 length:687 start_codon:yes stop_codon:yes gene_type:complete